mmetsp:Transcript_20084/g.19705  ORF Transcript_20084/g.19705 Transcript_20084/m.19705 type:complete len:83 (+) Transcript_20084:1621-1869(+)
MINPRGENYNILVFHQAAGRVLRKDILNSLVKTVPEFAEVDVEVILDKVNKYCDDLDTMFINNYCDCSHLDIEVQQFDFEIN